MAEESKETKKSTKRKHEGDESEEPSQSYKHPKAEKPSDSSSSTTTIKAESSPAGGEDGATHDPELLEAPGSTKIESSTQTEPSAKPEEKQYDRASDPMLLALIPAEIREFVISAAAKSEEEIEALTEIQDKEFVLDFLNKKSPEVDSLAKQHGVMLPNQYQVQTGDYVGTDLLWWMAFLDQFYWLEYWTPKFITIELLAIQPIGGEYEGTNVVWWLAYHNYELGLLPLLPLFRQGNNIFISPKHRPTALLASKPLRGEQAGKNVVWWLIENCCWKALAELAPFITTQLLLEENQPGTNALSKLLQHKDRLTVIYILKLLLDSPLNPLASVPWKHFHEKIVWLMFEILQSGKGEAVLENYRSTVNQNFWEEWQWDSFELFERLAKLGVLLPNPVFEGMIDFMAELAKKDDADSFYKVIDLYRRYYSPAPEGSVPSTSVRTEPAHKLIYRLSDLPIKPSTTSLEFKLQSPPVDRVRVPDSPLIPAVTDSRIQSQMVYWYWVAQEKLKEQSGDYLFHILFGKLVGQEYVCHDVAAKKQQLAEAIRQSAKDSIVHKLSVDIVRAKVTKKMLDDSKGLTAVWRDYQAWPLKYKRSLTVAWQEVEKLLRQNSATMAHIQKHNGIDKLDDKLDDSEKLRQQYNGALEHKDDALKKAVRKMLMSDASLYQRCKTYSARFNAKYDWSAGVKPYASDVQRMGYWFSLPAELQLIAEAFKIAIYFHESGAKVYKYNHADAKEIIHLRAKNCHGHTYYERIPGPQPVSKPSKAGYFVSNSKTPSTPTNLSEQEGQATAVKKEPSVKEEPRAKEEPPPPSSSSSSKAPGVNMSDD
jgi:hypothetical protein